MSDCRVGCTVDWSVRLVDRMTGRVLDTGPTVQIIGGRTLNAPSSGQVVFPKTGSGPGCCHELGMLRPWRYELEEWRCGVRVWVGPVVGVRESAESVTVFARDRLIWSQVRRLRSSETLNLDPALIVANVLALTVGNMLDPVAWDSALRLVGANRSVSWTAAAAKMGWDVIKPLLGSAISITMVDDVLHGGEWAQPLSPVTLLDAVHLDADLESFDDGFGFATEHAVRGASGVLGSVGGVDPWWGLVDSVSDRPDLSTVGQLGLAAHDELGSRRAGSLTLEAGSSGQLMPGAPVDFADLIPHRRVRVNAPDRCRAADGEFVFGSVSWAIGGGASGATRGADGRFATTGAAGSETVKVSFEEAN